MERYESLGVVGEGSYGLVLKCKNKETGQTVAVKKFLESEEDQNVKKIALREIRMLKRLRHENLINLIEFFRRKKRLYLVFEFVDHTVLDELESKNGGLDPSVARSHIFQVIRGVSFCHENQIIHRDVKPENVLVSRLGVVKLCDFGFARLLGGPDDSCTDYVATRWYRAPELLVGETKYGREVDIWAIGCLLSEMLTGDPLFPGESDIDQLYHIIQTLGELCKAHKNLITKNPMLSGLRLPAAASKPLSSTHSQWDQRTQRFISSCLDLNPAHRPTAEGLLSGDYFLHDGFVDTFLVQLREKVQEEFGTVQLPPPRKTSGQNIKKTKRPKGSPETISNKLPAKLMQPTPSRSSTQKPMKEKNLKSPHSLWLTGPKSPAFPLKTSSQTSTESNGKDTLGFLHTEGALTNLNSFSRHQLDFSRHPYAVSLDRSKDSLTKEVNRDPLREIRDNSKESKKELIAEREKKDVYRPPRSGWAKPRLLNDDLFLPTVSSVIGKPSSPLKIEKPVESEAQSRRLKINIKKSNFTMPTLNPIQRSSPSSAESFDFNHVASNLPFV